MNPPSTMLYDSYILLLFLLCYLHILSTMTMFRITDCSCILNILSTLLVIILLPDERLYFSCFCFFNLSLILIDSIFYVCS